MGELDLNELDLDMLFSDAAPSKPQDDDLLAALLGDSSPGEASGAAADEVARANVAAAPVQPAGAVVAASPTSRTSTASSPTGKPQKRTGYAWESALHLLPETVVTLIDRYPAIGLCQHSEFGLVVIAAYLEDTARRIRRNLKLGNDTFFYAPDLHSFAPDLEEFNCRVVVKTIRHQPGMVIRFWENTPDGDLPDRGAYVVRARGFERQTVKR